jgi:hypothetical protein
MSPFVNKGDRGFFGLS